MHKVIWLPAAMLVGELINPGAEECSQIVYKLNANFCSNQMFLNKTLAEL